MKPKALSPVPTTPRVMSWVSEAMTMAGAEPKTLMAAVPSPASPMPSPSSSLVAGLVSTGGRSSTTPPATLPLMTTAEPLISRSSASSPATKVSDPRAV